MCAIEVLPIKTMSVQQFFVACFKEILHHRNTTSSMKAGHLFSLFSTVQLKEETASNNFFSVFRTASGWVEVEVIFQILKIVM